MFQTNKGNRSSNSSSNSLEVGCLENSIKKGNFLVNQANSLGSRLKVFSHAQRVSLSSSFNRNSSGRLNSNTSNSQQVSSNLLKGNFFLLQESNLFPLPQIPLFIKKEQ